MQMAVPLSSETDLFQLSVETLAGFASGTRLRKIHDSDPLGFGQKPTSVSGRTRRHFFHQTNWTSFRSVHSLLVLSLAVLSEKEDPPPGADDLVFLGSTASSPGGAGPSIRRFLLSRDKLMLYYLCVKQP